MAEVTPYNPFFDSNLNPLARKKNDIRKRFVSPASTVSGGGNGVTSLDDPTYLGFSLRFDILSPLFNGATVGDIKPPPTETPIFDALTESAAGRGLAPPIDDTVGRGDAEGPNSTGESAVFYLQKVGENTRANYLYSFIQGLREVNEFRPYYWQTIDGLQTAWSNSLGTLDPFQGSAEGEGITIGCLEAIDLKISALFNLYKSAVYDVEYRRMILPRNLMRFNVYVDVHEIRNFKSTKTWLSKLNLSDSQDDVERFLNENTSKITFVFTDCVWDPVESGKVFENISNVGDNEMAVTSIKWQYSNVTMISDFSGIDQELNDKMKLQTKGKLGDAVKNAIKNQATKTANALLNRAEQIARARVQSTVLGNVFGLRNQIISSIQNPGALSSAIEGAVFQSRSNQTNNIKLGDNVLGSGIEPNRSLPTDNLYSGRLPQTGPGLGSSNVFGTRPSGPPPLNPNNVFG